jgi:hypothetical protein
MRKRLLTQLSLVLITAVICCSSAYGQSDSEQKIFSALDDESRMEFIETPLSDVVTFLSDQHDIPFFIDTIPLEEDGIDPDTTITLNLKDIPLRSCLTLLTRRAGLSWTVKNDVLLLTSISVTMTNRKPRVYDIRLLCDDPKSGAEIAELVKVTCQTQSPTSGVIDASAFRNLLIVTATVEGHEIVGSLLATLNKTQKYQPLPRGEVLPGPRPAVPAPAPAPAPAPKIGGDDLFGPPTKPAKPAPQFNPSNPFGAPLKPKAPTKPVDPFSAPKKPTTKNSNDPFGEKPKPAPAGNGEPFGG